MLRAKAVSDQPTEKRVVSKRQILNKILPKPVDPMVQAEQYIMYSGVLDNFGINPKHIIGMAKKVKSNDPKGETSLPVLTLKGVSLEHLASMGRPQSACVGTWELMVALLSARYGPECFRNHCVDTGKRKQEYIITSGVVNMPADNFTVDLQSVDLWGLSIGGSHNHSLADRIKTQEELPGPEVLAAFFIYPSLMNCLANKQIFERGSNIFVPGFRKYSRTSLEHVNVPVFAVKDEGCGKMVLNLTSQPTSVSCTGCFMPVYDNVVE